MSENYILVEAPCCASIRECNVRALYVIGTRGRGRILRTINAVRCYRGESKKVKIYPSNDIIVVEYYVTTRGNPKITVVWKPENMSMEDALRVAKRVLGVEEEEVLMFS